MNELLESVEELRRAPNLAAIEGALTSLLRQYGIDSYTHYAIRSPLVDAGKRPLASNFPKSWRDRYAAQRYVTIDPIVRAAYRHLAPFTWREGLQGSGLSKKQKAFMGEAAECGLRGGFTVPIFGPIGTLSILSVASDADQTEIERLMTAHRLMLHMAAYCAHEAIEAVTMETRGKPSIQLYPRERDCLLWAAKGKTSWEIGEILGISDGTVNQYLKSAAKKLSVYGRRHAVAKAITLGLIHP